MSFISIKWYFRESHRKISHYLNSKKIKTKRNTSWTNSKVHSYLKRYKEKTKRQDYRNKFYEMKWVGKMKLNDEKKRKGNYNNMSECTE